MPLGVVFLLAICFAVYRCCRSSGRSPLVWVPVGLFLAFVCGIFATTLAIQIAARSSDHELAERELYDIGFIPAIAGMVVGGFLGICGASRASNRRKPGCTP